MVYSIIIIIGGVLGIIGGVIDLTSLSDYARSMQESIIDSSIDRIITGLGSIWIGIILRNSLRRVQTLENQCRTLFLHSLEQDATIEKLRLTKANRHTYSDDDED